MKSKVGEIKNLVEFETGERPLVTKTDFPYGKILSSLKILDSTKSLIFSSEQFNYGKLQTLRRLARQQNIGGYFKMVKKGNKVYVWLQEGKLIEGGE